MTITKNMSKISIIGLILLLAISAMLTTLTTVSAQGVTKETYPFLGAVPNPVGVNQEVLLHIGITDYLSSYLLGWEGLTVTVIDPTGAESTLGPFTTDSTGGTGTAFTPTMVGEYSLTTNFPAQWTMVQPFSVPSQPILHIWQAKPIQSYLKYSQTQPHITPDILFQTNTGLVQ